MKKIVYVVLAVCAAMTSCNYESAAFKAMRASRDSLQTVYDAKDQEAQELLSIISEVEGNLNQIKEAEDFISLQSGNENASDDVRARLANDVDLIKNLLQQNKEKVAELEEKLAKTQGQLGGLRATINRLKADNEAKDKALAELQAELAEKNIQIQTLDSTVVALKDDIAVLTDQKTQAESIVAAQDKELHTAYYYYGTSKDLKNDRILIKSNEYNKSKFTEIDIREVSSIDFDSRSAILLSRHPLGSYKINIQDKKASLVITNVDDFWSMSKYLIVRIK